MPDDGTTTTEQTPASGGQTSTSSGSTPPPVPRPAQPSTPAAASPAARQPTPSPAARTTPAPTAPRAPASPSAPIASTGQQPGTEGRLVVGKGVMLSGQVSDAVSVAVEGTFAGATIQAGELVVGASGQITGQAHVTSAEIFGHFEGDLTVEEDLNVHQTGRVSGTIRYGEFQAAKGARLEGDIRTIGSEPPAEEAPLELQADQQAPATQTAAPAADTDGERRSLSGMLRRK